MKLHPLHINQDSKLWCSIAALAAVTGVSTEHARQVLKEAIGEKAAGAGTRRQLKGVYTHELHYALQKMAINIRTVFVQRWKASNPISLARYLLKYRPPENAVCIATLPRHFVAFDSTTILDNFYPNGIPFYEYPRIEEPAYVTWELTDLSVADL